MSWLKRGHCWMMFFLCFWSASCTRIWCRIPYPPPPYDRQALKCNVYLFLLLRIQLSYRSIAVCFKIICYCHVSFGVTSPMKCSCQEAITLSCNRIHLPLLFFTLMWHFLPWYHFTTVMWHFLPWYHFTTVMEHFLPWYHFTTVMEHCLPWYHFTTVM